MTKIYKVVQREAGALYSYWAPGYSRVEYRPFEWLHAPQWLAGEGYHLLAFDTLKAAREINRFRELGSRFEIWEAIGESEILPLPAYLYHPSLSRGSIQSHGMGQHWPEGTRMYRRIKLVERVPNVPSQEEELK